MEGEKIRDPSDQRVRRLLDAPQRRQVVAQLAEDGCGTIDDLVRVVAAREEAGMDGVCDEETRERVAVSLVHNHLPRLADLDLIEYDQRSGDIVLTERFDDWLQYIERVDAAADEFSTPLERPA